MKKIFALLLALGLVLALTACDQIPGLPGSGGGKDSVSPPSNESDSDNSSGSSDSGVIEADEDGFAYGFLGDTMRTAFFDFTVNSAYTCAEYEGYTPSEGNTLLVADVTFYNYTIYSQPMFDDDLQAQWSDDSDDAFALPITYARTDLYPNTGVEPMGDMFPMSFDLGIQEERNGLLVYEVPAGEKDYSLSYYEYFSDDTYGDLFFVYFTPESK